MPKQPTLVDWAALYQAARDFRQLAPWRWTAEDELFALAAPDRKDMSFCAIHGAGGGESGLAFFVGAQGYLGLRRLVGVEPGQDMPGDLGGYHSVSITHVDRKFSGRRTSRCSAPWASASGEGGLGSSFAASTQSIYPGSWTSPRPCS